MKPISTFISVLVHPSMPAAKMQEIAEAVEKATGYAMRLYTDGDKVLIASARPPGFQQVRGNHAKTD